MRSRRLPGETDDRKMRLDVPRERRLSSRNVRWAGLMAFVLLLVGGGAAALANFVSWHVAILLVRQPGFVM
jgi:fatty acid desaturase